MRGYRRLRADASGLPVVSVRAEQHEITEDEEREALLQLDPLWDELSRQSKRGSSRCWSSGLMSGRTALRPGCGRLALQSRRCGGSAVQSGEGRSVAVSTWQRS